MSGSKLSCKILSTHGYTGAPVFIWGEDLSHGETAQNLFDEVRKITDRDFSLVAFNVSDWNAEFSPWAAPAVFGAGKFEGKGKETLNFLEKELVPFLKEKFQESKIYLAGYSLAGLFSLWSLYESSYFDGAVCCSSSLWFNGWKEFAASGKLKSQAKIYMSLGDGEEKSKNKILATVGDRTRHQVDMIKKDSNAKCFEFAWNTGGHFENPLGRLAKGIDWVLG